MSEVRVIGLRKSFGSVEVLRGVDLSVPAGAVASVLGPSGCGKTTLLRILAGFERADAGAVTLGGALVAGGPDGGRGPVHVVPERRRVGVVPQEGALFPHLSVAGNVAYGLRDGSRRERAGRVRAVLGLVGLEGMGERMPHELSGGQQQRVAVARALAPRPTMVLLDEPFSALDAGLRVEVRETVRAALRADGATAVLVTHDQEEALSMSDLVAVMREGRIVQAAPPVELYRRPADLAVAGFLGDAVVLSGEATGGRVRTPLGELPVRSDEGPRRVRGRVTVVVRPEQIELVPVAAAAADATGPVGPVVGTVVGETFFGHDALVRVTVPGAPDVSSRSLRGGAVRAGDLVGVRIVGDVTCFEA